MRRRVNEVGFKARRGAYRWDVWRDHGGIHSALFVVLTASLDEAMLRAVGVR